MGAARAVLIILSTIELIFAIIAVGLSGYLNGKFDLGNSSVRFFVSASVITGLLSVACMISACLSQRYLGIFGCSIVASIYWLVAIAWFGKDLGDYIFHPNTPGICGEDDDYYANPDACDAAKVGAAAFAFGLLLLFLWLGSVVVAAVAAFSGGSRASSAASFRNSGGPAQQGPQYGQQAPQYGQQAPQYGQYPAPYPQAQPQYVQPQFAQPQHAAHQHQPNNFQPMSVQQQQQTNKVPV